MITKEEVKHISKLARLGLLEKEIGKFQKDLSSILDYIEKLKKVDISKIKTVSSLQIENITRGDKPDQETKTKTNLLDLAPKTQGAYLKVKSILK